MHFGIGREQEGHMAAACCALTTPVFLRGAEVRAAGAALGDTQAPV